MNQTTHIALTLTALLTVVAVIVQPTVAQPVVHPGNSALAVSAQDTEDRRREAAAAARARRRYQAAIGRREQPAEDRRREEVTRARAQGRYDTTLQRREEPPQRPQRIDQPRPRTSRLSSPPYQPHRTGSQLGALLQSVGQVARTIERAERGRFNLPREFHRAGRMIDRHQQR